MDNKAIHTITHMKASQNDPRRDAAVKPPENSMELVIPPTKSNDINVKIATLDHSLPVVLGIASIHPCLYAIIPAAKSIMY